MPDPIEASWLAVRRAADERARLASLPLIERLVAYVASLDHLSPRQIDAALGGDPCAEAIPRRVAWVDVGAGTGANQAWLGPATHAALGAGWTQEWHLLDHDAALLDAVEPSTAAWLAETERHVGGVETVATVLAGLPEPRVMTCSALLDLMTADQIDTLVGASVTTSAPALWSLSVTGTISLTPVNAHDQQVADLFNLHQRGESSSRPTLGPDAARYAEQAFIAAGWHTEVVSTPWVLGPGDEPLSRRFLTERAAAAKAAQAAGSDAQIESWLHSRLDDIDGGTLTLQVDHVDVLALPPKVISVQTSSPSA